MNQAMIELDEVSLGWRDRVALRDVSGRFVQGSLTAVVGPNGAGKSTLVKALMGQLSPLSGEIRFAPDAQNNVACLPQLGELDRSFPISVYDLVAMGRGVVPGGGRVLAYLNTTVCCRHLIR